MGIDQAEKDRRARRAREAIHSTALDGGYVDAETRADMDAYARGEITPEELRERGLEHARALAQGAAERRP